MNTYLDSIMYLFSLNRGLYTYVPFYTLEKICFEDDQTHDVNPN